MVGCKRAPYLLLLGRLLLLRGELVGGFHHDELALLDAHLERSTQRVLCELDLRVRGLDELYNREGGSREGSRPLRRVRDSHNRGARAT